MADKANTSQGAGAAPTADSPAAIRNVVLMGPSGGGKTTLVEALLTAAGCSPDPDPWWTARRCATPTRPRSPSSVRSGSRWRPLSHNGIKVNLIDTPGYADFVGELRAGLRAADCALFVIAANEGVDELDQVAVAGVPAGRHAARRGDHQARPRQGELRQCPRRRPERVRRQSAAAVSARRTRRAPGLIGLLSQTHYEYAGGKRTTKDPTRPTPTGSRSSAAR